MPLPTGDLKFAQGSYLTDGKRLVYVLLVLPDGQVLVEDVGTRHDKTVGDVEKAHIEADMLNCWFTMSEWAQRVAARRKATVAA